MMILFYQAYMLSSSRLIYALEIIGKLDPILEFFLIMIFAL